MLAVVGPTASGKSSLALSMAEAFGGEIVNYDSIQLYRRFDIGTAKPSLEERERIPHHLVDILEPETLFSAGDYHRAARTVLDQIVSRGRLPILVGGTGLYLRAVIDGLFHGPSRSDPLRERLEERASARGQEYPHRILARLDPDAARRIEPRDLPKVIRAIEVRLQTGIPLSAHIAEAGRDPVRNLEFVLVGLDPARDALADAIADRVAIMYEQGLVEEVRGILADGVSPTAPAFRAIGYRQVLGYIDGNMSLEEAIMLTERDTRRYAKRQMTWFRRQHRPVWFSGFGSDPGVCGRIVDHVRQALDCSP